MAFDPGANDTLQVNWEPLSDAGFPWQVTEARPESESLAVPLTVMEEVLTVPPLAGELMLRFGGVLSRLTVTDAAAEKPARFTAVPEAD
jgi:hypothetical protein